MRGMKGTPYQGGTRSPCFVRWPVGGVPEGVECDALTAHIDIFPTLAEITGATLTDKVKKQIEGVSIVPLLKNPTNMWDRTLMLEHHVGRWPLGQAAASEYRNCSIQDAGFELVENNELYDLKADPGENKNVIAEQPEEVAKLRATYEQWWKKVQPLLVNEEAYKTAPLLNPFAVLYWKQFGGGPIPNKAGEGSNQRYEARMSVPGHKAKSSTEE
jgi:arylsulfatase